MQPTYPAARPPGLHRALTLAAIVFAVLLIGSGLAWSQKDTTADVKDRLEKVERELEDLKKETGSDDVGTDRSKEDKIKDEAAQKPHEDLDLTKDADRDEFWKRQSDD